jgi:hypothetical protein
MVDKRMVHSLVHRIQHLVLTLGFSQGLESREVELLDDFTTPRSAEGLEALSPESFCSLLHFSLLILFEFVLIDGDVTILVTVALSHIEASSVPPSVPKDVLT